MAYAGLVKRAKTHFENCNNGPEETPVQGDCSYILTPRATGAACARRPRGPNVKNGCILEMHRKSKFKNLLPVKIYKSTLSIVL